MKDFKGTKGEWEAHLKGSLSSVKTNEGVKISLMIGSKKYYDEDERDPKKESWLSFRERTKDLRVKEESESEANAQLIAAAPELLSALKSCVLSMQAHPDCEPNSEFEGFVSKGWEALEKALKKNQ